MVKPIIYLILLIKVKPQKLKSMLFNCKFTNIIAFILRLVLTLESHYSFVISHISYNTRAYKMYFKCLIFH